MCLRIHNTTVKTTVVHAGIVDMHPWSWVLRLLLLLLLLLRVSMAGATCVAK